MSDKRILIDYTTIVSAANMLNCADNIYPATTVSPYKALLEGSPTHPASPMWLELASFSDIIENIVIHEKICALDVNKNDRITEAGRYAKQENQHPLSSLLLEEGILEHLDVTPTQSANFHTWIEQAASSKELVKALIDSFFELLKQPAYSAIPDLFSHSQTIYKFDGESIWSNAKEFIDTKEMSRLFRRKLRENKDSVNLTHTEHFYPEDILGFFLRGLYYNDVANAENIPYHPHGARSPIIMSDGLWVAGITKDCAQLPINFVKRFRQDVASEINASAGCDLFELNIPPVLAAVFQEAKRPEDCMRIAIQMRNTPAAVAYRECLHEASAFDSGSKLLELKSDLEGLQRNLRKELNLDSQMVSIGLWKFSFPVKIPGWLYKPIYLPGHNHLQFVRNLSLASISLHSLEGKLIEIFRST